LGILGQAGPTGLRNTIGTGGLPGNVYGAIPFSGIMQFDTADLALLESDGSLLKVILHEMGHVLGIGTVWALKGLIQDSGRPDPRFRGAFATQEYNRIFGLNAGSVPIESFFTAGPGSAEGHWRESTFTNELMTPFISAGEGLPASQLMSSVTVGSLADLGYQVVLANADPFTPSPTATSFITAGGSSSPSPPIGSSRGYFLRPQMHFASGAPVLAPLPETEVQRAPVVESPMVVSPAPRQSLFAAGPTTAQALATDLAFAEDDAYASYDTAGLEALAGLGAGLSTSPEAVFGSSI
jgi:hypothetical protein